MPSLVLVDSVQLYEDAEHFVGIPNAITVADDGSFYVVDLADPRIVHFGARGEWIGVIGRKGRGPGEFTGPQWMAAGVASRLFVSDLSLQRITEISTQTDSVVGARSVSGFVTSLASSGTRLVLGLVSPAADGTVGVLGALSTDTVRTLGPYPALFAKVPETSRVFGMVEVAAYGDTVVTAYEVSNHLAFSTMEHGVVDSIEVPPRQRRGARLDLFAKVRNTATAQQALFQSSFPFELAQVRPGMLAYVSLDQDQVDRRVVGQLYLTLIDTGERRTCGDLALPVPTDPIPRVAFRADTMVVLYQTLSPEQDPQLMVKRFVVTPRDCGW